jgi:hypothetical protein
MKTTKTTRRPATEGDATEGATVYVGKGKVAHTITHVWDNGLGVVTVRKPGAKSGHTRFIRELTVEDPA